MVTDHCEVYEYKELNDRMRVKNYTKIRNTEYYWRKEDTEKMLSI